MKRAENRSKGTDNFGKATGNRGKGTNNGKGTDIRSKGTDIRSKDTNNRVTRVDNCGKMVPITVLRVPIIAVMALAIVFCSIDNAAKRAESRVSGHVCARACMVVLPRSRV